jgi:alpha-amylase/alpha-mannosidase (GH57 family)
MMEGVIPRYRALCERGQVELSTSPYGHPILPLLIDFHAARECCPASPLPHHPAYPGGLDRAAWHVGESVRIFTEYFGIRPHGCWPSEGAISQPALQILDRFGFRWAASSANVLRAGLEASGIPHTEEPRAFNRPYVAPGTNLKCFFRDDLLSDLIGFNYATWHGDDAAQNFVHELAQIARRYDGAQNHAVLIALDGENAWEHYPFNGYYFLRALYAALAEHPLLELTTLTDCLNRGIEAVPLSRVVAGSWVHGTLATWMGDPAKNAAWDLLCEAKIAFDRVMASRTLDAARSAAAERQLALCESSDWFWWFGDYNPPEAVSQFDRLYRRQLVVLYRMLNLPPPDALARELSVGHGKPEHGGVMRRAYAG